MRHLRSVSFAITVAGAVVLAAGIALSLDPTWVLVGLLLAWGGVVKLIVVRLWRHLTPSGLPTSPNPGIDD